MRTWNQTSSPCDIFSPWWRKNLPQFHLRALQVRSKHFLLKYKTVQINNFTSKYTMKLSKTKHLQCYMNKFELEYRNIMRLPQIIHLSTTFLLILKSVFETIETVYVEMSTAHSMIGPIVYRNFDNTCHHQNGPNQWHYIQNGPNQRQHIN